DGSRNCGGPTFFCSAGRVPSRAGQTDTRLCEARGAEAPRQRTARGRLLQRVVPRSLQRQSLAPVFWQRNATRCFYIWPLTQIVTNNSMAASVLLQRSAGCHHSNSVDRDCWTN